MTVVWELIKNQKVAPADKRTTLLKFDEVLGLDLAKAQKGELTSEQQELIKQREQARKAKDFAASDKLRDQLAKQGVELEDTDQGTKWFKH